MIIYLYPNKLTNFFYFREEINLLQTKTNFEVEIHDLSFFVNKNLNKVFKTKEKKAKNIKKFKSLTSWKAYFDNLLKKKRITIINYINFDSFNGILVNYYLLKKNIKMIKYFSPGGFDIYYHKENKLNLEKVLKNILNFNKLLIYLKSKIYEQALKKFHFKKNYILYSGKEKINPFPQQNDKYYPFHTYDYSKFLIYNSKKKNSNLIVFIDSAFPYSISDFNLTGDNAYVDVKKWYNGLNNLLNFLAKKYSSKILIIPHHKLKGIRNPHYSKKFKIAHEIDAPVKYISKSKMVVACSCSTAISYAVANNKKLLLAYNNDLKKNYYTSYREILQLSKILNSPIINLNNKFTNITFRQNKKNYEKYKYNYLTSKKISKLMNYKIISSIHDKKDF